jgi:hypothetical protein
MSLKANLYPVERGAVRLRRGNKFHPKRVVDSRNPTQEAALRTAEMFRARANECMRLAETIHDGDRQVLEQIAQAWLFLADRIPASQIAPTFPANENSVH